MRNANKKNNNNKKQRQKRTRGTKAISERVRPK